MNLPNQRKLMRAFIVSVLASVVLYALSIALSDLDQVGEALGQLGIGTWAIVLSLSLMNYAFRFTRWQIYLTRLGHHIRPAWSLVCYLAGFAFTTTPGKAGEAVRSLYLKRWDVSYSDSLAAFFVERLVDVVAIALLSALAVVTFAETRIPVLVLVLVLLIMLPVLRHPGFHRRLEALRERFANPRLRELMGHGLRLLAQSSVLLARTPLYAGLFLALFAWGCEGIGLYLVLDAMGVEIGLGLAVGIYSVAVIVGAASFIPGGLGSTEAAMALMLGLAGADLATAVSATLVCRLATLWFAVLIGLAFVGVLELPMFRHHTPPSSV